MSKRKLSINKLEEEQIKSEFTHSNEEANQTAESTVVELEEEANQLLKVFFKFKDSNIKNAQRPDRTYCTEFMFDPNNPNIAFYRTVDADGFGERTSKDNPYFWARHKSQIIDFKLEQEQPFKLYSFKTPSSKAIHTGVSKIEVEHSYYIFNLQAEADKFGFVGHDSHNWVYSWKKQPRNLEAFTAIKKDSKFQFKFMASPAFFWKLVGYWGYNIIIRGKEGSLFSPDLISGTNSATGPWWHIGSENSRMRSSSGYAGTQDDVIDRWYKEDKRQERFCFLDIRSV